MGTKSFSGVFKEGQTEGILGGKKRGHFRRKKEGILGGKKEGILGGHKRILRRAERGHFWRAKKRAY